MKIAAMWRRNLVRLFSAVPRIFITRRTRACAALLAGVFTAAPAVRAQTAHVSGAQSVVYSLPTSSLAGVAVDAAGRIYIADATLNKVLRLTPASGGGYTQVTVAATGYTPSALAVDAGGNVYVVDTPDGLVYKETVTGADTYSEAVLPTGTSSVPLNGPASIAVDASGSVYIADTGNNRIVTEIFAAGSYTDGVLATVSTIFGPTGVAVDASGDVFISDPSNTQVLEELPSGGGTYTEVALATGLVAPRGLAVDAAGNVDFIDLNNVVKEMYAGSATYTMSRVPTTGLSAGVYQIAVDAGGNVYLADSTNGSIVKESAASGDLGKTAIGTTSSGVTLFFTFDAGASVAAPAILTQGVTGLDFADAGTGTCLATTYVMGDTCTVDVTMTPTLSGGRFGAVVLTTNSSTDPIATGYVQGTGVGPQLAFAPGVQTPVFSVPATSPEGVALDGSGNLYIADTNDNVVYKQTLTGGIYGAPVSIGSGLSHPVGTAVDGAGNVYIASAASATIFKETPSGSNYLQSTVVSGLGNPLGVAVDGAGNVYVADYNNGAIYKETPSAGSYVQSTVRGGLVSPTAVAVDLSGNVYFSDPGTSGVYKETLTGSTYTLSTVQSGVAGPAGLALDGAGDVYVADYTGHAYVNLLLNGGYTSTAIGTGLLGPIGMAVDGGGNVYIADKQASAVLKLDYADVPSLIFASTAVGGTSSAQTVTLENIGNADLTFPAPGSGNNPSIAGDFTLNSSGGSTCPLLSTVSSPAILASGSMCTLPVTFAPASVGSLSGSLVLTDNNLSVANAVQSIGLSGTSTTGTPLIAFTVADHTFGDAAFAVSASSASTGAFAYAVVSGPATISGGTVTLTGIGTVVLSASQVADTNYNAASQNASFNVAAEVPVITFTVPGHAFGDAPFVVSASSASAGAFTYAVVSGPATISGATVTLTGGGTVVLSASQAANGNFDVAAQNASFAVSDLMVWVGNGNSSLSVFDPTGAAASPVSGFTGGGLAGVASPLGMAFDHGGFVWVADSAGGVSEFSGSGVAVGSSAITAGGISNPLALAVDGAGQVWVANGNGTVSALANDGTALSPAGGFTGAGLGTPGGVAVDLSGNVWVSNTSDDSVTEMIGVAAPVAPLATAVSTTTIGARP